jgi:cell division initiation protein
MAGNLLGDGGGCANLVSPLLATHREELTPPPPNRLRFGRPAERRGKYPSHTVDPFIDKVLDAYEELWHDCTACEAKIKELGDELERYRGLERRLSDTLLLAEAAGEDLREKSRKEADEAVAKAHSEADAIVAKAGKQHEDVLAEIERLKEVREQYETSFRALLLAALETFDRGDAGTRETSEPAAGTVEAQSS